MSRRSFLMVGYALALGVTAAVAEQPAAPRVDWSGVHVGVEVVGSASEGNVSAVTAQTRLRGGVATYERSTSSVAGLFGGLVGYDHQIGSLVAGLEVDAMRLPSSGAHTIVTYRARLGWSLGNTLVYVTAGGISQDATLVRHTRVQLSARDNLTTFSQAQSGHFDGFAAGGGVDYRLSTHVGLRMEALYLGEGSERLNFPQIDQTVGHFHRTLVPPATANWSLEKVMARMALTYHFN